MAKRPPLSNPHLAVAYIRVSKAEQALGPEAQRAAIERWAAAHETVIVAWHVDHVTGGAPIDKRPGLLAAVDALSDSRAGLLVVAKRDRLARDPIITAMAEQLCARQGARVVSAAGEGTDSDEHDPSAQLMRRLVDAFAEYERALIRARTRAALGVKRARGERVGRIPFGKRLSANGTALEPCPSELAILQRMAALRASGHTVRAVAELLEREGVRGRSGAPFSHVSVCQLLNRSAGL